MSQKHKLSIYLVKEGARKSEIFKEEIKPIKIGCGELYLKRRKENPISWKSFFNDHEGLNNLLNNNHSAIFLVEIDGRCFILSFGAGGRHMLNNDVLEDDFGLKTVLNLIDTENLRSIDKRDMSGISKNTREQVSRNGKIMDFGINPEYDLIYGITGKSEDSLLGDMLTGKKALSGSFEVDCNNVDSILKEYLKYYNKDNYKKKFPWIDNIKEVQDGKQIDKFNKKLLQDLNKNIYENGDHLCWLSVPDIVDWNNVVGFSFSKNIKSNQDNLKTDIFINQLSEIYKGGDKEITIKSLKNKRIYCFDGDGNLAGDGSWSIYNCIYCEITFNGKTYFLNNGKWYNIDNNFYLNVDQRINQVIRKSGIDFIDYDYAKYHKEGLSKKNKGEAGYNKDLSKHLGYVLMDAHNIKYQGSSIELCDLFGKSNLIHVKRYSGSQTLSHLFNQGLVSGKLLKQDNIFVKDTQEKIKKLYKKKFNPQKMDTIIYGMISKTKKELKLPAFSKITLYQTVKELESLQYKIYVETIYGNEKTIKDNAKMAKKSHK
ncbi:MAG: TIGR04141 family sporadically distributed protein [Bacilli bacterium]|nr:TIGR04141 family sporadically distributed protein [Bacilli bacterium]